MHIRKLVMPVAGNGTRSLVATKNIPKEMLPIYDKPTIQYLVEEAVQAGIGSVIFITNREKRSIEDHFDHHLALESALKAAGKTELLNRVQEVAKMVDVIAIRQKEQLGLGHAILCAKPAVNEEYFAAMVGDDILLSDEKKRSGLSKLIEVAEREQKSVIGVMEVAPDQVHKYGIIAGRERSDGIIEITDMVEKPQQKDAPSNLAIVGRYVLSPKIFEHLEHTKPGHGGEIQLTDAMKTLMHEEGMLAVKLTGIRFDIGDWVDYLSANLHFALKDTKINARLRDRLQVILDTYK